MACPLPQVRVNIFQSDNTHSQRPRENLSMRLRYDHSNNSFFRAVQNYRFNFPRIKILVYARARLCV